jgi:flavorubredoxin
MRIKVKNNVDWVGKIDWELKRFHGDELSTHRGSSYNSYLIEEAKTVLIDTVWRPYGKEFVENLSKEIDLKKIDYIIANHGECDHSGALPVLMQYIPDVPIYCTENGVKSIKGQYHQDWNFRTVKTGDKLDVGNGKELIFVEMKMLHWPDSLATYLTGDNILFSMDAFGQHFASQAMFNDLVDQCELYAEAIKYYANILAPFSPLLTRKLQEIDGLNLPIEMIAPSHGVIWRDNPGQIVDKYREWADNYQENQITIFYDTMWDGTKSMADAISWGIKAADDSVTVKSFNISKADKNDIITEVFKSKAVVVGSPTVANGITSGTAGILEEIEGLKFKKKKAVAFGCYGWSGEAVAKLSEHLAKAGFEVINDGLRCMWNPDDEMVKKCMELGEAISRA